jgi:class 3 adenylate cyclase
MASDSASRQAFSAVRVVPLVVGLLTALVILPVMTLGYLGANDNTGRLLTQNRDATLDGLEQQLRSTLDGVSSQLAVLGAMIERGEINPDQTDGFDQFMAGTVQGQISLVSIGWMEPTGPMRRWVKGQPAGSLVERHLIRDVENVWARAERLRRPHWNNPVISHILREAIIPHIQPVLRDGQLRGVLITVLTSQSISRYFDRMENDITPFVLVGRDRVLIHRNMKSAEVADAAIADDRLPMLDEVNDVPLALIWADPRRPAQDFPGRSDLHWTWLGQGFQAQTYSYRSIEGYGTEPWLVGFHNSSLATFRVRWIVQTLFWGSGAILLLAITLAYFLSRRAVAPAGRIADAARALERLDFDSVARQTEGESQVQEVRDVNHALNRAARVLKRFQTYVPRALVGQLMTMDASATAAQDRAVSILFVDLAGYTRFADGRSAEEVATYLNRFFSEVGPVIEAHGGTIDKYTGDGLMAVWGVPVADPDHVQRAWKASRALIAHLEPLIASHIVEDQASCRVRLGLHTGRVLAGDLGFEGRIDYTVVGRTVNIAQRCQAALKGQMGDRHAMLAITESVRIALGLPLDPLEPLPALESGEPVYAVA